MPTHLPGLVGVQTYTRDADERHGND